MKAKAGRSQSSRRLAAVDARHTATGPTAHGDPGNQALCSDGRVVGVIEAKNLRSVRRASSPKLGMLFRVVGVLRYDLVTIDQLASPEP